MLFQRVAVELLNLHGAQLGRPAICALASTRVALCGSLLLGSQRGGGLGSGGSSSCSGGVGGCLGSGGLGGFDGLGGGGALLGLAVIAVAVITITVSRK